MSPPASSLAEPITLRDVREEDLGVLFEQQCEPAALRMAGFLGRDRRSFMVHWRANLLANPSAVTKVIVVAGQVAGYVTAWNAQAHRFVGYWLGERYWGRGLATAALSRFVALDVRRPLHAIVAPGNAASLRVLAKSGFTKVTEPSERAALLASDADDGDGVVVALHA